VNSLNAVGKGLLGSTQNTSDLFDM